LWNSTGLRGGREGGREGTGKCWGAYFVRLQKVEREGAKEGGWKGGRERGRNGNFMPLFFFSTQGRNQERTGGREGGREGGRKGGREEGRVLPACTKFVDQKGWDETPGIYVRNGGKNTLVRVRGHRLDDAGAHQNLGTDVSGKEGREGGSERRREGACGYENVRGKEGGRE